MLPLKINNTNGREKKRNLKKRGEIRFCDNNKSLFTDLKADWLEIE